MMQRWGKGLDQGPGVEMGLTRQVERGERKADFRLRG